MSKLEDGIKRVAQSLIRGLDRKEPLVFGARWVAHLVVIARRHYGRELIDRFLEELEAEKSAVEQGYCPSCKENKAEQGQLLCAKCERSAVLDEAHLELLNLDASNATKN